MVEHDKAEFSQIIKATFSMNPNWKMPDKDGLRMWWACLAQFSIEQVRHGFQRHITDADSGRFQPMPADVIKHMTGGNKETKEARAVFAWNKFLSNYNIYQSAVFDDPAIHYAISMVFGSWIKAGDMMEKDMPFRRKDFISAYNAYTEGMPYPSRMIGVFEQSSSTGESMYNVIAIGDSEKCKSVMSNGSNGNKLTSTSKLMAVCHES